ncbi:MAG: hypothetical protein J5995_00845 [Muribaculaceae bacterium]|nr:hypothetical protein [Muribaculaceae bacterium]
MSGMSGSLISPIFGSSCEMLSFETVLIKPVTAVLQTLKIHDVLQIEIVSNVGVIAKFNSQTVGIVLAVPSKMDKLIECIDKGTVYKGTITSLDIPNGVCSIKISAV